MTEQHQSKLAQKLAARKPKRKIFEIPEAIDGIDGKIAFEVLRNSQTTRALTIAHAMRDEDTTGKGEDGKKYPSHPGLADHKAHFDNLLTIATLHLAARDPEDPDCPAFPSPRFIRDNLGNFEIEVLTNLYNRFVGEVYPGGIDKLESTESLIDFARMVSANWKTDLPDVALSGFSHEVLVECFIRLCVIWDEADKENESIRAENAMLRSAGVVPVDEDPNPDGTLSIYAVRLLAETANTTQSDVVNEAAHDIGTKQQAIVAMRMLGWKEGSPAWKRVIDSV